MSNPKEDLSNRYNFETVLKASTSYVNVVTKDVALVGKTLEHSCNSGGNAVLFEDPKTRMDVVEGLSSKWLGQNTPSELTNHFAIYKALSSIFGKSFETDRRIETLKEYYEILGNPKKPISYDQSLFTQEQNTQIEEKLTSRFKVDTFLKFSDRNAFKLFQEAFGSLEKPDKLSAIFTFPSYSLETSYDPSFDLELEPFIARDLIGKVIGPKWIVVSPVKQSNIEFDIENRNNIRVVNLG